MSNEIPEELEGLLFEFYDDYFSRTKLVNLRIISESTLWDLDFSVPKKSRLEFNAALRKGHLTLPVIYGRVLNEVYDSTGNFVCCLEGSE